MQNDNRDAVIAQRSDNLFIEHQQSICQRTDHLFVCLMLIQWLGAVAASFWLSPRTWSGPNSQTHLHVWFAIFLGGAITLLPIYLARTQPGAAFTRHIIAIGQLLMSALLIHLTGGRIETHFHVFGSLAFLAFYRDWKVLLTGTLVTAADHLLGGIFWPQSLYGVHSIEAWRWLEHAGWVIFEDIFLFISCLSSLQTLRGMCERDAMLEASNLELEHKIDARTASLRLANTRLEELATTDPLTGLPNHRALVDIIDKEVERSHRYNRSCSLLFLDLDHFKALNDGYGHGAGDTALHELGGIARKCLRSIDTLGRWGGEEFVVLLPECDAENAMATAERIRSAVAAYSFLAGKGIYLTCSIGFAVYPNDTLDRSGLVAAADRAMYAAKRLGRNQVRYFGDPIVLTMETEGEDSREDTATQGTVAALAGLVEARDLYTGKHTEGVAEFAIRIAQQMQLDAVEVRIAGLVGKLHDIGKVAIPDIILHKPGRLTEEEWTIMQRHAAIGAEVVSRVPSLRMTAPGIRSHHEYWNGQGYPDRLAGEAIPLASRIVAVADAFSAITTDRPYRAGRSVAEALVELKRCSGIQFDPAVVNAVEQLLVEDGVDFAMQKAA